MEITSKSNEKVKYIKSLNERKFRQKYGAFYVEGVKVISELLDIYIEKAIDIEFIAYSSSILKNTNGSAELLEKIKKLEKIEILEISEDIFYKVTDTINTQGILCVLRIKNINFDDLDKNKNILVLDKIQDAGNIGTIIRAANAFGINNILCTKGTTDVYSPKVVRSTMLSIIKSNIVYTDNIIEDLQKLKNKGYTIIGTSLYNAEYMNEKTFLDKNVIILGNEANGVEKDILDICDKKIKIKIDKSVESLNVSSAASILLYEQYKRNV